MQMTFRWYGDGNDDITPEMIRQIPGVGGLVWALHDKQPGEIWTVEEIEKVRARIEGAGFHMDVVESVNVHDDIKIGLPTRDQYIENYKTTLKNLAKFGVKVVTYNFMPIFDWTRTDLFHPLEDGSNALYYEKSKIQDDYKEMAEYILKNLHGKTFPGWEPERMAKLDELFEAYRPVTKEKLWENLQYFLEAIMPTCHETGIKMAIHQDDPPWDIFGIPRLLCDKESIGRFLHMVDDEYNCLCLCSGSLGANTENNVADIIRTYCDRIAFAISETSDITRTEIFRKFPTETVTVIPEFWKLCEPITTVVIPAMYARITEDISGEKKPIADRATDCMTGHWESCICGDVGICWNDWMEKSEVTENSQILYGCSIYL